MMASRVKLAVAEQMLSRGGLVCMEPRELHLFLRLFTASEADRFPLNRDVPILLLIRSEQYLLVCPILTFLVREEEGGKKARNFDACSWVKWSKDTN